MPSGIPGKVTIICPNCKEEKEHSAKGRCKSCYYRDYYSRQREAMRARGRSYYHANTETCLERTQAWRENNRDYLKAYDRRAREQNKERRRRSLRRWKKQNPEKLAVYDARYRAHKNAVANTLIPEQAEFERKIGEATYPGEKLHLHHIVPISKGGGHTWGNIAFIPVSLNMSIRDKLPEEVYMQMGLGV